MTVYAIVEVKITDDAWIPDYAANAHHIVHRHGGTYLSRSANITTLEGAPSEANVIALVAFPSLDAVRAFAADPAYAPHGAARRAGSVSRITVIDDSDVAGTVPYLTKG